MAERRKTKALRRSNLGLSEDDVRALIRTGCLCSTCRDAERQGLTPIAPRTDFERFMALLRHPVPGDAPAPFLLSATIQGDKVLDIRIKPRLGQRAAARGDRHG